MQQNADREYEVGVRNVRNLLGQRRAEDAVAACDELLRLKPALAEPLLLLGRARQLQGRFDDMLSLAADALEVDKDHRGAQLQFAEASIFCGRHDCALHALEDLEVTASGDAALLQHIAGYYAQIGRHDLAHRCYLQAVDLDPDSPKSRYNLAASYVAMGGIELAEQAFSRVIDSNPSDFDAWQNRSTLRKQTPEDNHVAELLGQLDALRPGDSGEVPLSYALAKEYEDLGEIDLSFRYLSRGARARRQRMDYNVGNDVDIMRQIRESFSPAFAADARAKGRPGAVFVTGLPRSGTTLVDRILSSHSAVTSLGEINDFALALTRLGGVAGKVELLEASLGIEPDELGEAYMSSVASYGPKSRLFIDKTPANFLYIGLIRRALPDARVLHVRRNPVDSCLAMYRTLFRMGYPFSYDLDDLASYYIAYHELMTHWQTVFPGEIIDVVYEDLVENQESVSKSIIDACDLEWEEACLHFDRNASPVATASAAQVRKPIYRDSVARWRRYEKHLQPLIDRLTEAGIAI